MSDQQWIDKFAIQELIYSHSDAITRGDLAALEPLYAPDVIWEAPFFGYRLESARALFDFLPEATATVDLLVQTPQNPVVRLLDASTATATTTMFELNRSTLYEDAVFGAQGDEINLVQWGLYYDDVSKSTGNGCSHIASSSRPTYSTVAPPATWLPRGRV